MYWGASNGPWCAEQRGRITSPAHPCTPAKPAQELLATLTAWLLASLPEASTPPVQAQWCPSAAAAQAAQAERARGVSALRGLACDLEPRQRSWAQDCAAPPIGAGSPGISPAPWLAGHQPHPSSRAAVAWLDSSVLCGVRPDMSPPVDAWGEGRSTSRPSLSLLIFQTNPNQVLCP